MVRKSCKSKSKVFKYLSTKTCLSKEREARKCIRVVKAFTRKGKQENARRSKGKQEKPGKGSKSKKQQQPKHQNQKQNATHSNTQQRPGQATASPRSLTKFSKKFFVHAYYKKLKKAKILGKSLKYLYFGFISVLCSMNSQNIFCSTFLG